LKLASLIDQTKTEHIARLRISKAKLQVQLPFITG